MYHEWEGTWKAGEGDRKQFADLVVVEKSMFMGMRVPGMTYTSRILQNGPGMVYLRFRLPFGYVTVFQSVTPISPTQCVVTHSVYTPKWSPRFQARVLLAGLVRQFERDIWIWNNKKYQRQPVLAREDALIKSFRRWYSQFYSENSKTAAQCGSIDW
eukprot:TRINITY_DN3540_c0_g1_i2.p3 TRINITY_DN3540_c0_g1~~TRINITY_DN3540_c0_g1_i2.p3  ORF type:complete len:157 (+),score=23.46 TRINITY_DN3540_c0_g1_i2:805-1275(+)